MVRVKKKIKKAGIKAAHRYEVVDSGIGRIAGKRFHFIGAGGVGMSGLAGLILKNGGKVRGSDALGSSVVDKLCEAGADIRVGHRAGNVRTDTEAVVISAAVKEDNCELQAARKKGVRVYKYAEMAGMVSSRYECIAVAGTHGKSTTCGWVTYCMQQARVEPNFIIGAEVSQLGVSSGTGSSRYFVAEACEYDRSFLNFRPKIGCVLNIEADHLDYYKDEEEIEEAFGAFCGQIRRGGVLVGCGDDLRVLRIMDRISGAGIRYGRRVLSFGFGHGCAVRAEDISLQKGYYWFTIVELGEQVGRVCISLPGRYNILNALAAYAILAEAGLERSRILELLGGFSGMERRLMYKGEAGGAVVIDDYAHHPTEIKCSLEGIRERYAPRRLWCVFQPHQYSRTRFLLDDFSESFKLADVTIVPEIYFVRDTERARREVNAEQLVERIKAKGSEALFIKSFSGICEYLKANVKSGDVVVTMGAGDVWKVADEYIQRFREDG